MTKKLLAILLAIMLTLAVAVPAVLAAGTGESSQATPMGTEGEVGIVPFNRPAGIPATTHPNVNTEALLRSALSATTNPTVIRLTSDIDMTGAVMTMGGTAARVVHIYSYGPTAFTVNRTADAGGVDNNRRHITSSGVLNLHNVHLTSVTPAGATAVRGGIRVTGGHLHLHEGSIISNNRAETGGGIRIEGGTVTMHGGEIRNNYSHRTTAGSGGGGVLVTGGTSFTMNGGLIYGNRARNTGGGVQIAGTGDAGTATFTMSGGIIQNNIAGRNLNGPVSGTGATSGAGGALHLNSGGVARLSGDAALIGNQAYVAGGAVRMYGDGTAGDAVFTMTDNVNISGNRAGTNGGGISSRVAAHHINITNWHGEISGNIAGDRTLGNFGVGGNGGGIHIQAGGTGAAGNRLTIGAGSTGRIVDNLADHGGGIFSHLENLPATGQIGGRISIAPGVTFEGNEARAGMRVDEGLGQRNLTKADLPQEGSLEWLGVIPGSTTVATRTHLFNNYDINVRQWIYLRAVEYSAVGSAAGRSEMTAFVTQVAQAGTAGTAITTPAGSSNIGTHNVAAAGTRVAVNIEIPSGTLVPVHATATATSMVRFEVIEYPNNTSNPWTPGPAGTPARIWRANSTNITNNPSTALAARNIISQPNNANPYRVTVEIYDIYFLSLANVPSELTHTGQTAVAGSVALAIPGENPVAVGVNVALTAGGVAQNHYFLGWYRLTAGYPAPAPGMNINVLYQGNLVRATGVRPNPHTVPHTFNMPAGNVQYFALWGARDIIGASAARVTFHAYGVGNFGVDAGNPITSIEIPVDFGQPLNLAAIEAYLASEETAFAFWGWFTHEGLATGIPRADLDDYGRRASQSDGVFRRRPAVGEFGFYGQFPTAPGSPAINAAGFTRALSFTEAQWTTLTTQGHVVNGSLDLYAIWSPWGDVDDNDAVNVYDLEALAGFLRFAYPRPVINMAPADVHRDGVVNVYDLEALAGFLRFAYPRPVLGARPVN